MKFLLFVYAPTLFVDGTFQGCSLVINLVKTSKAKTVYMESIKLFILLFLVAMVMCHC
jgi:hypothetical protein